MTIELVDYKFEPAAMTIAPGTIVTAVNDSTTAHTWTSDTGVWNSGNINPGASFSFTFATPGTYKYECSYHYSLGMIGTITVS